MKLFILNPPGRTHRAGHVEMEVSVDEAIAEIEKAMNDYPGRSILVQDPPGSDPFYVRKVEDLRNHPNALVEVVPQLSGG